jgi:hypothetical protein
MAGGPGIVDADEGRVISLISGARHRVVFVAPGVTEAVAEVLAAKWRELGSPAVHVILDVDPEVCRLGYGTIEGLRMLRDQATQLHTMVFHQPGVRISLLIADNVTLVYTPTPLLVEADATGSQRPNGILLDAPPPDVLRDIGLGENGIREQSIGLDGVESRTFEMVEANLNSNPPVKFDLARKVRVFTSKFQFVELEVSGVYISRKKVPIPSYLMGLAGDRKMQSQFHAQFNLVGQATLEVKSGEEVLTEKYLHNERMNIERSFLISLPGYGRVVLRANTDLLMKAVEVLRAKVETFQHGVIQELQKGIDANIASLVDALFPAVKQSPPQHYTKFHGDKIPDVELRNMLEADIKRAFGEAATLVETMKVSLVFKDLTYESLKDADFLAIAQKAIPGIDVLHEEYDAAKATRT